MNATAPTSFLDRTVRNLRGAWRDIADRTSEIFSSTPSPDLPDKDMENLRAQLRDCLEGRGGEVSARIRAANMGRTYLSLSPEGRKRFLSILAHDFDVNRAAVDEAAKALSGADLTLAERMQAERKLRQALRPPWMRLLTQFNALPEGITFLVDLRAELLPLCKDDPSLKALEHDLQALLTSWFDVGFLELRRIQWDSPASLLEKLIAYEAVHAIRGWDDLKNRLDSDRRCFAFFHPRMPAEPLIFVWVALVNGISSNIQALLEKEKTALDPYSADTAIFYSISNAQEGLAKISFGDFLIKRVVDELTEEFENLKTFATLSPIPGYRPWLDGKLTKLARRKKIELLNGSERKALVPLSQQTQEAALLQELLARPDWHRNPELAAALKAPLMRLCARYLAKEKRKNHIAYDKVAHFHLSNGARIEHLNWLGNTSERGFAESYGIMVNYRYKLDDIENNHEAYRGEGQVKISSAVRSLLRS